MSSYYKKINGKNYDKAMLDLAEKSVTGKGDGRISLADSKNIVKQIKDGGRITDIEKRTLNYILENYQLTETALKHIEKSLSEEIIVEDKKGAVESKSRNEIEQKMLMEQPAEKGGSGKKKAVIIIILLLALISVFAFFKYFHKTGKIDSNLTGKDENVTSTPKVETDAGKTESNLQTDTSVKTGQTVKSPVAGETEVKKEKIASENEYIVKDKDSLIKISEALYGDYRMWKEIYRLNRGKISNPTVLFPGQVLILPEKNKK